ncbi:hypothetical protein MYP_544 [Sporocytophaga myxococcoides]|uniref:Uncharacterized protein n=1 Tax=Sporocytophaga myxococcoides TaxID=153721 RepID=A0A098LAY3_9BACT|nr:hypothetical protein [Sporocytophaga myxococcoides]GAL83318.1 hypothetical protein MYP_544 [Sporocytophaga myxococcoides]
MAKKVKIPVKEDARQNSTQYGYQGNVRNQYGYSPADVDFYDDKDKVEKKDSRQAQVVDASHEEKLYRLLFRISKKLKEEEEKAAATSSKEPEIKAPQTPAASDPHPQSAASPDSKTSAESDERDAVLPVSALSPKKTEAKDLEEPQNTVSAANDSRNRVSAFPAPTEGAAGANTEAEKPTRKKKAAISHTGTSEETKSEESESAESKSGGNDSEERADVAEQPEHAQSATPSDNNSDNSRKAQEVPALAGTESKASNASVEEKSAPAEDLPEPGKKAASGGGSGGRVIDMADASMDGGPERVEQENAALDKKEKTHLEVHSKAKAAQAGTKIGGLSTNQKKKEDATTKLDKTKDAVVEKTSEKEAEVNAGQVGKVAEAETPEVNKDEAKSTLNQSLQASLPQTVEDVDNFKDNRVASKIGDKVKAAIDAKAGEVTGTFEVLDKTPKPDEPRKSVPFADIEQAPATPEINAGNNLIPKVDEKSIDLNSYLTESDNLLKKEGIKQEHLDLVDSGDLFEAKKIQKDIDKKAKEEPGNLRTEEKELHGKNEAELQKKEADEKGKMQKEREAGLGSARGSQVGTKGSLEDKKKEVTDHINKIYEDVNKQVQDKLTKLKTDSLAAFDREEAAASSAFENNVNTKMDKFKDERYSGVGGKFNKVRDWFLGIDDLPEVKQIFEEEKAIYINRIDGAISKIINDSQKVIDECKTLIANARKEIEEYVKGLSPALQKIGEEAEKEIKKKLDELDEKVNKAAEELKEELAKKRTEAIANIDKKIEKMKEEMSGFLSKMGDLLVDAALKFFKWALEAAGHSADEIMGIINKGKAVLTAVVSDPIQFLKNLAAAVGGGVKNFGANIMKHLGEGFMNWLTGQLNSLPIQLPERFDLKGIVSLTLQVLGLTYASLRGKLSNKVGEDKVQMAEAGVEMMMEVKEKGPIAMYDMMADKADSIKNEFIEGAKEWAITNLIKQGLIRLATMINPAGAIVQAVLGIYNGIIFLVNNWDRILAFVNSVFDSIAAIASGAISQASAFVEKTMAQTIPLILDFIAQQLNLSGIAERITKIIHRIRKPIDQVIDKVIDWITKKVKQLADKLLGKNKDKNKDKNKEKAEDTKKDFEKEKDKDKKEEDPRSMEQKLADLAEAKGEAQALLDKKDTTIEKVKAGLPAIKKRYNLTKIEVESLGDFTYDVFVEINPKDKTEKRKIASVEEMLSKSKANFNGKTFKMQELKTFIMGEFSIKDTKCGEVIKEFKDQGELFECASEKAGPNDSNKIVSFDRSLLSGEVRPVEINESNRSKFGYDNPAKDSSIGLIIVKKGLIREAQYNYSPEKEDDKNYLENEARYKCARSGKIITWAKIALGHHDDVGCSVHWNDGGGHGPHTKPGHTQTKDQNRAWNKNPDNYQGPEDRDESNKSGGSSPRYILPGPPNNPDSHKMWWDPTHPDYIGNKK